MEKTWQAGSTESGDALVVISKHPETIIELHSKPAILKLYGMQIKLVIKETLEMCGIHKVKVSVQDNQALDYVIRGRIKAACKAVVEEES